ncbi:L,D-transpeptidase family protein [Massilia sp. TWP1-3-3]|uniref:L,D-transpeptidase family protein n=1 Tax=Massilia sp. TWP1-3-3 TaxID=2804573 RepID=UPI003CF8306F
MSRPFTLRLAAAVALLALALPCALAAPRGTPAVDAALLLPRLYNGEQPALLWSASGQAALALDLLRTASEHGLDGAYYDVDALAARYASRNPADADAFDHALSQAMLQFISDLHGGRVKPDVRVPTPPAGAARFDAVAYLRQALAEQRLSEAVSAAAPALPQYKRIQATLQQYRTLAAQAGQTGAWSPPALPANGKLVAGSRYPGLGLLRQRLQLLGDLDGSDAATEPDRYSDDLAAAIKHFQARHGLDETGQPGRDTIAALKVPLSRRVRQLALTLERMRWLPPLRPGRVIVVNVAAYRLWAFDTSAADIGEPLEMRVIVGKAARTQTPLFIGQMSYLEFNPYWNVPRSIAVAEIAPKLARNPGYLRQNNMELVAPNGQVQGGASAAALRSGAVRVRQRPGPQNALGAVKFAMPNTMNIYLHSTSAQELFGKVRRDLSHGCIRVERPAELAAFVLADQAHWSPAAIATAMAPGPNRTVRLGQTIPVVLFYATAATDRSGRALFANDIYQRDDKLAQALGAP